MKALDPANFERKADELAARYPQAAVYGVDPYGANFVDVPAEIASRFSHRLRGDQPLELMSAGHEDEGAALFVECRQTGEARGATSMMCPDDSTCELHLLNAGEWVLGVVVSHPAPLDSLGSKRVHTQIDIEAAADSETQIDGETQIDSETEIDDAAVIDEITTIDLRTATPSVAGAAVTADLVSTPSLGLGLASAELDAIAGEWGVDAPPADESAPARDTDASDADAHDTMVVHLDAVGLIRDVNVATVNGLGRTREQLIGTKLSALLYPDDVGPTTSSWVELVGTPGGTRHFKCRYLRPDGEIIWVEQQDVNKLETSEHVIVSRLAPLATDVLDETPAPSSAPEDLTAASAAVVPADIAASSRGVGGSTESTGKLGTASETTGQPNVSQVSPGEIVADDEEGALVLAADRSVKIANAAWANCTGVPSSEPFHVFASQSTDPQAIDRTVQRALDTGASECLITLRSTPDREARRLRLHAERIDGWRDPAVVLRVNEIPRVGLDATTAAATPVAPGRIAAGGAAPAAGVAGAGAAGAAWANYWSDNRAPESRTAESPAPGPAHAPTTQTTAPVTGPAPARSTALASGLLVGALALLAGFLRFFRLGSWPGGLSSFEAQNLALARANEFTTEGWYSIAGNGQPVAPIRALDYFDASITWARSLSAIVGVLTVIGVFVVARRVGGVIAGWMAGLTLAVMVWHLYHSRAALGVVWWPLLVVLALLVLEPLMHQPLRRTTPGSAAVGSPAELIGRWFMAGLLVGAGVHVANAHWVFVVVTVVFVLMWRAIRGADAPGAEIASPFAFAAGAALVALPLALRFLDSNPDPVDAFDAIDARNTVAWTGTGFFDKVGNLLEWWGRTWWELLVDPRLQSGDASSAVAPIGLVVAVLFVVGLVVVVAQRRSPLTWLILASLATLAFVPALTDGRLLRHGLAMAPLIAIVAGLGAAWVVETFGLLGRGRTARRWQAVAAVGLTAAICLTSLVVWVQTEDGEAVDSVHWLSEDTVDDLVAGLNAAAAAGDTAG